MVFSSIGFLFYFLPIFLLCYAVLPWRNAVLLLASLIFYAWGEFQNLPLLLICIVFNYGVGRALGVAQARGGAGKAIFVIGLAANLSALTYYKYFQFMAESLGAFFSLMNLELPVVKKNALPLGISFFTFHAISYLVDVYRKKTPCEKNIIALFTYIIMFPQLVAGPIVRFSTVAKQLHLRRLSWERAERGAGFFVIGLAQKILLANALAQIVDSIYTLPISQIDAVTAWVAAIAYSLQIYFDFAGYSLMAIGLGLICGFSFPRNFNFPYAALSMTDFWRRWHMSLSRWFRDYVYIPLGGNRQSQARTAFNLMTVFFLCGLWHGANWTFVVWGLLHGSFLILERGRFGLWLEKMPRVLRHCYTMMVVILTWVLFRAESFAGAIAMLKAMFSYADLTQAPLPLARLLSPSLLCALFAAILLATPVFKNLLGRGSEFLCSSWMPGMAVKPLKDILTKLCLLGLFLLCTLSLAAGAYNPFIYFRF